jgi:phosphopantetheinyl transferase (holo-ACP synthase)
VANLPSGKPVLEFSPALKSHLEKKQICQTHLSLADERGIAVATVILECAK